MDGQGLDPLFLTVFSSLKYIGGRLGWVLITIFGFMTCYCSSYLNVLTSVLEKLLFGWIETLDYLILISKAGFYLWHNILILEAGGKCVILLITSSQMKRSENWGNKESGLGLRGFILSTHLNSNNTDVFVEVERSGNTVRAICFSTSEEDS